MNEFNNPIMVGPDPFILLHEGVYYLYLTRDENVGYKVYTSEDLQNWEDRGYCLKKEDVAGEDRFWAPEVMYHNGKFYMAYTSTMHVGIAVSDSPLGPFRQEVKQFCNENEKEIDGDFLVDDDGQVYLFFVRQEEKYGNSLWGAKMKDDMTGYIPETAKMLMYAMDGTWEKLEVSTLEGSFVIKHNGKYYMSYSANHTWGKHYAIGYAVAESPLGEYKRYEGNPILASNENANCPGHHCFTTTKDGKDLLCAYHTHYSKEQVNPRVTCIDRAKFVEDPNGGDDILVVDGPNRRLEGPEL